MSTKSRGNSNNDSRPWFSSPAPYGDFYVDERLWQFALWCGYKGKSALFVGPTGCGKTSIVSHIAVTLEKNLRSIPMGGTTDARAALIGTTHLVNNETRFRESHFVQGLQDPDAVLLLDDITRASFDALNLIMPALDQQRYISLDESDPPRIVHRCEGVRIFATANIGDEYTGTRTMDRALKDRFLVIEMDYPPREAEIEVLTSRTECLHKDAEKLVNFAQEARDLWRRDELSTPVSTRLLLEAAEAVTDGFAITDALERAVLSFFDSTDGADSERTRLRQLLQKF